MKANKRDYKFSLLLLLPSMILLGIFVYGFIINTFYVSMTDWSSGTALKINPVIKFTGTNNYKEIFTGIFWGKFRQDMVNAIFYWILILAGTIVLGFCLAVFLDHYPRGETFFRTLFLYPMALSFIVTGTIWNWLLQPEGGINVLPTFIGLPKIRFLWLNDYRAIFSFDWQHFPFIICLLLFLIFSYLARKRRKQPKSKPFLIYTGMAALCFLYITVVHWLLPPVLHFKEMHGFNIATTGIILAAVWQYSGYTMAIYLAGLRGLDQNLYEAAKIDGAGDIRYYLQIALPNLKPITLSAFVMLSHVSLKIFALIFAMSKPDNPVTGHPSVNMFMTTFRGNNFAMGAVMAVILFLFASTFIIPYLVYLNRQRRE